MSGLQDITVQELGQAEKSYLWKEKDESRYELKKRGYRGFRTLNLVVPEPWFYVWILKHTVSLSSWILYFSYRCHVTLSLTTKSPRDDTEWMSERVNTFPHSRSWSQSLEVSGSFKDIRTLNWKMNDQTGGNH